MAASYCRDRENTTRTADGAAMLTVQGNMPPRPFFRHFAWEHGRLDAAWLVGTADRIPMHHVCEQSSWTSGDGGARMTCKHIV